MSPRIGQELLYLSRADVRSIGVTPTEMNDAMTVAFRAKAEGRAWTQPKMTIVRPDGASFRAKAGVLSGPDYAAVKWLGYFSGNESVGLPDFVPLIILNEGRTGMPIAVMDGIVISALRTGALTAIAARHMARREAESAAFIACGTQARSNLVALGVEFRLRRVVAYSRRVATAEAFAEEATRLGLSAEVVTDPRRAIRNVDIVVSSVPHGAPGNRFLDASRLSPGTFVSMVDLGYGWDSATLSTLDRVITDDIEQSGPGGSEKMNYDGAYEGDLADLIGGRIPGRRSPEERNGFVFGGVGLADTAAAVAMYERAVANGIGKLLPL